MRINTYGLVAGSEVVVEVQQSKSGLPCLTEAGGGYTNTGETTIICNKNYNKKKAICVFTKGQLACGNHAIIPVAVEDHVIYVERQNNRCNVYDFVIVNIAEGKAVLRVCECGTVGIDYSGNHAIEAAIAKSLDYHCRTPYYIRN